MKNNSSPGLWRLGTGARSAFLALLLTAMPALAQMPPNSIDLPTVLALSREASPRLALERQDLAIARAERRIAGAWPNPTVSYNYARQPGELTNFEGARAQEVTIEFPLLIAGQHAARTEAADRGIEAARARLAASGNNLAADSGAAFVALLLAQEKLATRTAGVDELSRLRDIVAGRQVSGMASQYELLRVDVEQASWQAQTAEAEIDLAEAQAQLATLLGFPGWQPRATGELRPLEIAPGAPEAIDNPAFVAARKEEDAAQASVELARRERFPEVSLNVGRFWTNSPFGATNAVGLTVEIPLFDTRGGALDKAQAEALSAKLRRRLVETEWTADVYRYGVQVTQRSATLERFRARMLPNLPALKQMAEDAYRLGKSSITELLDATRARYEAHLEQLALVASLMEAQLRLQAARGKLSPASAE
ncbi:MAG: TolC family protein [Betaproteobacteria bacterium]|nr:TolC family protein [Betaproteobacteria bacterium]MCL2886438.1 TolC family protein [Betaproteobacteria bacterium]